MSPRSVQVRVADILTAIDTIEEHHRRGTELRLASTDPLLLDAVVRQLAIIGEAASHLPEDVTSQHPEIPWRGVVAMRLLLDHEYHKVDPTTVWRTVREDLPPVAVALRAEADATD